MAGGLENRFGTCPDGGSNPSPSAKLNLKQPPFRRKQRASLLSEALLAAILQPFAYAKISAATFAAASSSRAGTL